MNSLLPGAGQRRESSGIQPAAEKDSNGNVRNQMALDGLLQKRAHLLCGLPLEILNFARMVLMRSGSKTRPPVGHWRCVRDRCVQRNHQGMARGQGTYSRNQSAGLADRPEQ